MTNIDRRVVLRAIASISAAGASTGAFAPVGTAQAQADEAAPANPTDATADGFRLLDQIDRLTSELSEALEGLASIGGGRNAWHIVVPRASQADRYPYFISHGAPSYRRDGRGA